MKKRRKRQGRKLHYSTEKLFHIDDISKITEDGDVKKWEKTMCGVMVQFSKQSAYWPWCPKCERLVDNVLPFTRTTKHVPRVVKITEQRFIPPIQFT